MNDYISTLDSERFGFPVAKISNSIDNPNQIVEKLKNAGVSLIIARIDSTNIKLINQLEEIGFTYKDAQLTFNYNLHNELPPQLDNKFTLGLYRNQYLSDIIRLTQISFENYGHYFADDKLDKSKCREIYTDWIVQCCENRNFADEIIVAEMDQVAIGYLAVKIKDTTEGKYAAGVIGAVAAEHRKMGIFKAINIESMHVFSKLGCNRIENNVLVTNFPVMKTYTSLCYNVIRSELTMHYWYI